MGGGLGGGSSNAAVTLMALNLLWGNKLSTDELLKTAGEIGSDVPFFITGGTALGQGRGELLTPLELTEDWWIVLVCPNESRLEIGHIKIWQTGFWKRFRRSWRVKPDRNANLRTSI